MSTSKAATWLLPSAAVVAGVLGADAVWVVAAVASGRPCSWMALLVALDVALLLRLTGVPAGLPRIAWAVLATALAVALAQWLLVATQMGIALGLQPVDSALRLGPALAWQLLELSLGRVDLAWLAASLPAAALMAMPWGRERSPAG